MNSKRQIALYLTLLIVLVLVGNHYFSVPDSTPNIPNIEEFPVLCSEASGRCIGRNNCRVCSDCSLCGYCNSGGSCGVCSTKRTYKSPKPAPSVPKKSNNRKTTVTPIKPFYTTAYLPNKSYALLEKTSLRKVPDSTAEVLQRLAVGNRVEVVDAASEKFWC